jgi:hypothetical protein
LRGGSQKEAFTTIVRSLITKFVETAKAIDFAKLISVELKREASTMVRFVCETEFKSIVETRIQH